MKKNFKIDAWGVELRTNDLGFRDNKSMIPPKEPDEFRIIVLGDSFTVSAGVDFDLIYTRLLDKKIKEVFQHVNIINLAVGGYNIIQYRWVLEEVGLSLDSDMVLLSIFPYNDFEISNYKKNMLIANGEYQPKALAWYEQYYAYRAYIRRLEIRLKKITQWIYRDEKKSVKRNLKGWTDNLSALNTISQISKKNNIKMAVAVLPNTGGFDRQREIIRHLKEYCRKHDILIIDLYEPFVVNKIKGSDLILNILEPHPNKKYNALVAEFLFPHLIEIIAEDYGEYSAIKN